MFDSTFSLDYFVWDCFVCFLGTILSVFLGTILSGTVLSGNILSVHRLSYVQRPSSSGSIIFTKAFAPLICFSRARPSALAPLSQSRYLAQLINPAPLSQFCYQQLHYGALFVKEHALFKFQPVESIPITLTNPSNEFFF